MFSLVSSARITALRGFLEANGQAVVACHVEDLILCQMSGKKWVCSGSVADMKTLFGFVSFLDSRECSHKSLIQVH